MGVKNEHEEYVWMKEEWQKCLDFTTSEKVVHSKGELYLPRLLEDTDDEYAMYVRRAPLMMYGQRAIKAMVGMVMRKPIRVKSDKDVSALTNDVDDYGNDFQAYCAGHLQDFLTTGRGATLIDVPNVGDNLTVLQAEALGVRPRFIHYEELNVINWRTERRGNKTVLVLVVLKERVKDKDNVNDEFTWKSVHQYRVLDLVKDGQGEYVYRQRVFNDSESLLPGSQVIPRMQNKPLNYIPIVFHGGINIQMPPLNAVVDMNKHHYMLGADEVHGLRTAALPTPYFFGEDPKDKDFPKYAGPTRIIGCEKTDAKTGFREFTGMGMKSVADKLQKFEDSIIMLSVQVINETANQSATTSSIDYSNATATLAGIVMAMSKEYTKCLQIATDWANIKTTVKVQLNTDFVAQGMTAQKLLAVLQAYLSGAISYDTFYNSLADGEVTDPAKEADQEMTDIKGGLEDLKKLVAVNNPPATEDNTDAEGTNTDGNGTGSED